MTYTGTKVELELEKIPTELENPAWPLLIAGPCSAESEEQLIDTTDSTMGVMAGTFGTTGTLGHNKTTTTINHTNHINHCHYPDYTTNIRLDGKTVVLKVHQ
jgi:hypothetical protein